MSILNFVGIRDTAIDQIKAAFAENKKLFIGTHPGQFNEAEIKRLANRTPAVLTSLMRYSDEDHTLRFVSWVLYRAGNTDILYDGALKIVSAIIPVIRNIDAEWSIGGGDDIEAECLYSGSLDQINITLWGVRWNWKIQESVLLDGEGGILLPDDLEYFEGYDAAHLVGTQSALDTIDLRS
jgi:hypothetical protein